MPLRPAPILTHAPSVVDQTSLFHLPFCMPCPVCSSNAIASRPLYQDGRQTLECKEAAGDVPAASLVMRGAV